MTSSRRLLCGLYGLIALIALVATWSQNLAYFGGADAGGPLGAFGPFLSDLRLTPAARSISLDISLFLYAAAVLMVVEARRLKVRFVWAYIVGGLLIAISVTFPLFLIAREIALSRGETGGKPGTGDLIGLALLAVLIAALCGYILGA
ncbi:MAG TPA: DUF2834 domain-containing protein [Caulobacteraceae bacterium]